MSRIVRWGFGVVAAVAVTLTTPAFSNAQAIDPGTGYVQFVSPGYSAVSYPCYSQPAYYTVAQPYVPSYVVPTGYVTTPPCGCYQTYSYWYTTTSCRYVSSWRFRRACWW